MGQGPRAKPKRLGEKLLQIREGLGLSQNGMARHMGLADALAQSNISEFESGRREPSLLVLLKYARGAGVSVEVLIDDELDLPRSLGSGSLKRARGRGESKQKKRRR